MKKVAAIAWVAVREAIRQKLAVNLLVFALALVVASFTISTLTFGEQYRIIVDIGLSAMEISVHSSPYSSVPGSSRATWSGGPSTPSSRSRSREPST